MIDIGARIVFRDSELCVVDKPPTLVSCGPDRDGRNSVESLVSKHLGGRTVWAIHQLDRETSGLNLFALKKGAVQVWADRLKADGAKRYLAITHGIPTIQTIDVPLAIRPSVVHGGKLFPCTAIAEDHDAKLAVTEVVAVQGSADGRAARVELRPRTGRQHQIRVHLAHVGHPLFGEKVHVFPPCREHPRQALHAWRLVFRDVTFEAPLAPDLVELSERLGLC